MSSQLISLEGQPYLNFINSKSKETKVQYKRAIERFLKYTQIPSLADLLSLSAKDIEQLVINYITNLNARGLSHDYINVSMAATFHLTDMNDILLNKRKISKFQGERKKMNRDRAYTLGEIKLFPCIGIVIGIDRCPVGQHSFTLISSPDEAGRRLQGYFI